ncbi:CD48 antigen isoform X2 [Puntigrus tetrazona]|uniref:CD48 antigen isoform X2 n=1 Tax=Puntigrus tetrazona TaxID=1606681 RepID=UPI001C897D8E|nr:CD48 antigen isoform X2 [Puntigrus tetrazona]
MWLFIVIFISIKVLANGEWDEVKTAKEGDDLTLHTGVQQNKDTEVIWFLKSRETRRIAQMNNGQVFTHYEKRLAGRLRLDEISGSLTIRNISASDSGVYEVSVTRLLVFERMIKIDVYAPVSVPAIECRSLVGERRCAGTLKQPQKTEETCSVSCSVRNDRDVFISWYKGGELLNRTSDPDLNINLSLPLELHHDDPEIYSCTATNPVNNKTVRLHKDICPRQEGCVDRCGVTEALVRLVLSGLVGIFTVVFLLEHLSSCSSRRRAASSV